LFVVFYCVFCHVNERNLSKIFYDSIEKSLVYRIGEKFLRYLIKFYGNNRDFSKKAWTIFDLFERQKTSYVRFDSFGREGRRGKKGNVDDDAYTPPTLPPSFSFILSTSFCRAHTHTTFSLFFFLLGIHFISSIIRNNDWFKYWFISC